MEILEIAIKAEGGVSKLATALGERQNVVSNWKKRGLPRAWRQVLEMRYQGGGNMPSTPASRAQAATETVAPSSHQADPLDLEHSDQERRDGGRRESERRDGQRRGEDVVVGGV